MTNISTAQAKPPLGVGSLIGESFSILFGKFLRVFLVAYGPTLLGLLLSGALLGFGVIAGTAAPDFGGAGTAIAFLLTIVISIVTYGITTALLVQLAYDAKLGRQIRLGKYLGPAFAALIPIAILSLVVGVLIMIGLALLIIPGLWIYAVFSVVAPAIVIERAGFGGLGRSVSLTKEYRWPIVGAILLLILIMIVVELVAGFFIGIVSTIFGSAILDIVLRATISTFGAGLGSILIALIYARLREIKEGVSVDQIAAVFD